MLFSTNTYDRYYNGDYGGIEVGDTVVVIDEQSSYYNRLGTVVTLVYGDVGVAYGKHEYRWTPFTALSKVDKSDISFKTTITQII